jgi:hypothetical protein
MFIAHLGVGLAAKKVAPKASLGVLLFAGEALDVLCGMFVVTGIERMRPHPGLMPMSHLEFLSFPWSHGLLMSLVWASAAMLLGNYFYRSRGTGLIIGLLVFSHWVLDFIAHGPDLPLLFVGSPQVGLGLWNSVWGTMVVELGIMTLGVLIYIRTTKAKDVIGNISLATLVVFFTGLFFLNHFGPPPPPEMSPRVLALPIFSYILLWPWGAWVDRHRILSSGQ